MIFLHLVLFEPAFDVAIISSLDPNYFDPAKESGQAIGDVLWRALKTRGGRRGYSQKLRHIQEGLNLQVYSNNCPWVTQQGREYAKSWNFSIVDSVLQGATVWEVVSSEEEQDPVVAEPKAKAAAKAWADESFTRRVAARTSSSTVLPKATGTPVEFTRRLESSSSRRISVPASSSRSSSVAAASEPKAAVRRPVEPEPRLRPRVYLPDTVSWYDRLVYQSDIGYSTSDGPRVQFLEVESYSAYRGYKTYQSSVDRSFPKFILALDWHQVLDRSRTEGSWNNTFPQESITFLKRVKELAKAVWGHEDSLQIIIISHIEHSRENLERLSQLAIQTKICETRT